MVRGVACVRCAFFSPEDHRRGTPGAVEHCPRPTGPPTRLDWRRPVRIAEETKSATYLTRFKPSVKEAGEKAAADDRRSLNSLLEKLLTDFLKANCYLPSGKATKKT